MTRAQATESALAALVAALDACPGIPRHADLARAYIAARSALAMPRRAPKTQARQPLDMLRRGIRETAKISEKRR